MSTKSEEHPKKTSQERISLLRGSRAARIVLLDDESAVRAAMKLMLEFYFKDYVVAECTDGDQVCRAISREPPDLLITDYSHPGLSGEEMLEHFARRRVKFPLVISSAFVAEVPDLQKRLLSLHGLTITLLNKPFQAQELRSKVLECLKPAPSCTATPFDSDRVGTTETKSEQATRHPSVSCKSLLDEATKNLFQQNAFRITGLPVDATTRQVAKHADRLKLMEELGQGATVHAGVFALKPPPTMDQIRDALQKLKDPEKRLVDEFFWFWPSEFGQRDSDEAGAQAMLRGGFDEAVELWSTREDEPTNDVVAKHNLAVLYHLCAVEWDLHAIHAGADEERRTKTKEYWQGALKRWKELLTDDRLWDKVANRIRQIDDARLSTGFARRMRVSFPAALSKISLELALAYAEARKLEDARFHVELAQHASHGLVTSGKTAESVLNPTKTRLKEHIRIARERTEASPSDGAPAVQDLLTHATPLVAIFDLFFGEVESDAKEVLDETAAACIDCLVSYQKKTEDNRAFVDLLQMTLALADAVEVRQRIEKNIQIGKNNLAFAELAPIRTICEAAAKAVEADPASGDKEAQRILSTTSQILSQLSSSATPQDTTDRAKDEVALALMHCAVVFGNKTEKWKPCIAILEESLRIAVGSDVKARVTINLQTVTKNAALYRDLIPISSAPSLSTMNGVGFALYGCTDEDPTTGSYLATYYFVFFAIPIFPIGRYRVTSTGNGYRFFGKAPLRTFDKGHLVISVGLILWLIIAISSTRSTSTTASDTPAPSVPVSAPRPLYDVQRSEIDSERLAVEALENQVGQLGREIESERLYVDATSQYAVNQFNGKVERYNALVRQAKAATSAFNQKVADYNAKLRR